MLTIFYGIVFEVPILLYASQLQDAAQKTPHLLYAITELLSADCGKPPRMNHRWRFSDSVPAPSTLGFCTVFLCSRYQTLELYGWFLFTGAAWYTGGLKCN